MLNCIYLQQICTLVKFSNSKITYPSDFLVSDNIQYECVLGWDFINRNKLSLSKGPGKGYFLVRHHAKTSIRDNLESMMANLVGVTPVSNILRLIACYVSQRFKAMPPLLCLRVQ